MSFHECGGNVGDDVYIPLPQWVMEVGSKNPDIFFTDREGRRNHECLTWGIDEERILRGRTAIEVCYSFSSLLSFVCSSSFGIFFFISVSSCFSKLTFCFILRRNRHRQ